MLGGSEISDIGTDFIVRIPACSEYVYESR